MGQRCAERSRTLCSIWPTHWIGRSQSTCSLPTKTAARLVPRFFARYAEPDAKGVDAMSQTSWFSSACPHCRKCHWENFHAFPPQALIPAFIRKATADGARGIVVVPYAVENAERRLSIGDSSSKRCLPGQGPSFSQIAPPLCRHSPWRPTRRCKRSFVRRHPITRRLCILSILRMDLVLGKGGVRWW